MFSIDNDKGGSAVLDRIIVAYGFKSKLELCKHLGIAASSLSMRYKRDLFPADLVIKCMADTGARLEWLAIGKGEIYENSQLKSLSVDCFTLDDGALTPNNTLIFDRKFLPKNINQPQIIIDDNIKYIIETTFNDIANGLWLVDIESEISVKQLERVPVKRLRITGDHISPIECGIDDIKVLGKVVMTCK